MVGRLVHTLKARFSLALAFMLVLASVVVVQPQPVQAAQLRNRSIYISTAEGGVTAQHKFTFNYVTGADTIGSIQFEYCLSPLLGVACTAPTGMDATGATLTAQTGEVNFTVLSTESNKIVLTRPAHTTDPVLASTYTFDGITNPTDIGTFFVRITSYVSADATGPYTDFGGVANSITAGVDINSEVPPYLRFCVGLSITGDCGTADGNLVDLGTLSSNRVSTGSSQMMVATNAPGGMVIVAYGTTMTSGNNEIAALDNPTPSAPGNSQFGLNLRANNDPTIGGDPVGGGIAQPTARYNIPNRFTFTPGDTVAASSDVTDNRKFTASYIVNVTPAQQPGIYTATLTYICSATF